MLKKIIFIIVVLASSAFVSPYVYYELLAPDSYDEVSRPTPNLGEGKNGVEGVVLHHTATKNIKSSLRALTRPSTLVSCHVLIDKDGTRFILAQPEQITWHAGWSSLHGKTQANNFTIGIEFQGDTQKQRLTQRQIKSAIEYLKPIVLKYHIPIENIVTHEMIRNEWIQSQHDTLCDTKCDISFSEFQRFMKEYKKHAEEK